MKIKPRTNYVTVKKVTLERKGGIILPESNNKIGVIAKLIDIGPWLESSDLRIGDTVIIESINENLCIGDNTYIINVKDVLATIEK